MCRGPRARRDIRRRWHGSGAASAGRRGTRARSPPPGRSGRCRPGACSPWQAMLLRSPGRRIRPLARVSDMPISFSFELIRGRGLGSAMADVKKAASRFTPSPQGRSCPWRARSRSARGRDGDSPPRWSRSSRRTWFSACPASTSRDTSFRSRPCSARSAVPNIERVNINSQCMDTLFCLNGEDIESRRIIDQRKPALRRNQLADLGQVLVGVGGREHEAGAPSPSRSTSAASGFAWSTTWWAPSPRLQCGRLRPRCGRDHGQIGELPDKLGRDRANAARAADDQNGGGGARHGLADVEAIEQRLPGGDRGQRQGCGFRKAPARRVCGRRSAHRQGGTRHSSPAGRSRRHRRRRRPA